MEERVFDLQLFAEAGTFVNTTNGNVNAYTGSAVTTSKLSPTMKTYYDTELLENTREKLVFQQLGKVYPLPANHGEVVEWRKFNTLGDCERLQEAVIPQGDELGMTATYATIEEYGKYFTVSQRLELHAIDDIIAGGTEELGASAGLTYDKLIRAVLATNPNVNFADEINRSTGAYVATPTTRAGLITAMGTYDCFLTVDMVQQIVTEMITANIPFHSGNDYLCVLHPDLCYDLMRDPEWQSVKDYDPDDWYNGEIGRIAGVRFIRTPLAPCYSATNGNIYQAMFLGKDAYGVVDPAGAGMETIIHTPDEVGGPLNQFSTVGTKFSMGTKVLYPERLKILECGSRRGSKTSANMGAAAASTTLNETAIVMALGSTRKLWATTNPGGPIVWTSSDATKVLVQDGLLTALGSAASVTITATNSATNAAGTCTVTVLNSDGTVPEAASSGSGSSDSGSSGGSSDSGSGTTGGGT